MLPTLWFYNRWWNQQSKADTRHHYYRDKTSVKAEHKRLGNYYFYFQQPNDALFTDNETNTLKVTAIFPTQSIFVKDAFHDAIIKGENVDAIAEQKKREPNFPCL